MDQPPLRRRARPAVPPGRAPQSQRPARSCRGWWTTVQAAAVVAVVAVILFSVVPLARPPNTSAPHAVEHHDTAPYPVQLQQPVYPAPDEMSAHGKRVEVQVSHHITNDEEWKRMLTRKGVLIVLDVFSKWAGPCESMQNIFKRMKMDYGEELAVVQAQADGIAALEKFRDRSCPCFMFFYDGTLVNIIKGPNAPVIERTVKEQVALVKSGQPPVPYVVDGQMPGLSMQAKEVSDAIQSNAELNGGADAEETLAIIKPDAMHPSVIDEIMELIKRNRIEVVRKKKIWLTHDEVKEFYVEHQSKAFFHILTSYMSSAPCIALVLKKANVIALWRGMMGPANSHRAKDEHPKSIRALFGTDNLVNAVYGSDSAASAERDIHFMFETPHVLEMPMPEVTHSMKASLQKTLVLIKPDAVAAGKVEEIIERIMYRGFKVMQREEVSFTSESAIQLYEHHKQQPWFEDAIIHLSSEPVICLVIKGDDAINGWREMIGPTDPAEAREQFPMSIRALYGTDIVKNAVHGSDSIDNAIREIQHLFPRVLARTGSLVFATRPGSARDMSLENLLNMERTVALIKPDAYAAGKKDEIVERIKSEGFTVVAEKEVHLSLELAQEFYREHNGKPFFEDLTQWMSSSPIYAMVLQKESAINSWRELAGPTNSVKAKEIAPNSIRSLYGTDGSQNAVHGSDSPSSAEREIKVIFGEEVAPLPPNVAPSKRTSRVIHESARRLSKDLQRTFALIKPDAYGADKKGDIIEKIKASGFNIVKDQEVQWTLEQAQEFYREHEGKPFFEGLTTWMSSAPIYAMILEKPNAISAWRELAGPTNSEKARELAPQSIRALFGTDGTKNAVHGSDSKPSAAREIGLVFGDGFISKAGSLAVLNSGDMSELQRTVALIKPDAMGAGKKDEIIAKIKQAGFTIVKEAEMQWPEATAKEFYKEHAEKPFYGELVAWMSSAPIYAMVLEKEDAIKAWRELAGPTNSEKARESSPSSIRALFGTDGSKNAVHGSDSPTSAERETMIVFGDNLRSSVAANYGVQGAVSEPKLEQTLALIKPDAYGAGKKDGIVARIKGSGFSIVREAEVTWTPQQAGEFYREHEGRPFYETLVTWMSSAPIYAMVLEKESAITAWRALAGPTNSEKARETAPDSIRAAYGTDGTHNAVHGSDSPGSAQREIGIVFGSSAAQGQAAPQSSGDLAGKGSDNAAAPGPGAPTTQPNSKAGSRVLSRSDTGVDSKLDAPIASADGSAPVEVVP
ncbi:nucleoside diphosphate kinase [Polychytrium aggregatum]|uniref:nucleoside diphosphate kinase n=1 Tax=Polychytrium aggregatum TaxID=110093 RepID=UPI0022FDBE8B|nr:nucleoside diphosphate kinase [Polychytrium aggregatum]KAI9207247.1 nucleoside diphosphate kinase [Polychytrium aggregatum]